MFLSGIPWKVFSLSWTGESCPEHHELQNRSLWNKYQCMWRLWCCSDSLQFLPQPLLSYVSGCSKGNVDGCPQRRCTWCPLLSLGIYSAWHSESNHLQQSETVIWHPISCCFCYNQWTDCWPCTPWCCCRIYLHPSYMGIWDELSSSYPYNTAWRWSDIQKRMERQRYWVFSSHMGYLQSFPWKIYGWVKKSLEYEPAWISWHCWKIS